MLAALAGIGTRKPHIRHPALIDVHGTDDQRPGLQLHDQRPDAEIQQHRAVGRVGIGGENQLFGGAVQYAEYLVGDQAGLFITLGDGGAGNRGVEKLVGLDRPVEIGIVIGVADRVFRGIAMHEGVSVAGC